MGKTRRKQREGDSMTETIVYTKEVELDTSTSAIEVPITWDELVEIILSLSDEEKDRLKQLLE
jgi:hypothetical protein